MSTTFKDRNGREHTLAITVATVKRTKNLIGVSLPELVNDKMRPLADLIADPVRLVDVLYCCLKPELDAARITDEQFGESLAGDCLNDAADAFCEALTDFFPDAPTREALKKVMSKVGRMRAAVNARQAAMLPKLEQKLAEIPDELNIERFSATATSSPESSEFCPII